MILAFFYQSVNARKWSKLHRENIKKLFRKQAGACPAGTLRSNDTKQNENQKQS